MEEFALQSIASANGLRFAQLSDMAGPEPGQGGHVLTRAGARRKCPGQSRDRASLDQSRGKADMP